MAFVSEATKVLLLSPSGVGKIPLSVAMALKASRGAMGPTSSAATT